MATLLELEIKISANSPSFQTEIARASRVGENCHKAMQQGGWQAAAATLETQKALGRGVRCWRVSSTARCEVIYSPRQVAAE